MIKTKSILERTEPDDGIRVCVMRSARAPYTFDLWLPDLGPSYTLLKECIHHAISWTVYKKRYRDEITKSLGKIYLLRMLKNLSDSGKTVTLLCWETTDFHCYRYLLKEMLEKLPKEKAYCACCGKTMF